MFPPSILRGPALQVPHHAALTILDLTNLVHLGLTTLLEDLGDLLDLLLGHDNNHTNTAVECASHFVGLDPTELHERTEDGEELERGGVDPASNTLWQDAGNVLSETTAGDVRKSLDETLANDGKELLDVNGGGDKELVTERPGGVPGSRRVEVVTVRIDNLANERETVRVDSGRGDTENDIAGGNVW